MKCHFDPRNILYIQDNATPDTARDTAVCQAQQDVVEVIDWPAPSSDMNPIKHV